MEREVVLRVKGLTKSFHGILALENINLDIKRGEILGIHGENGAGKSVFVKLLSGSLGADCGSFVFEGEPLIIRNEKTALKNGIVTVHQDIHLFDEMTVGENLSIYVRTQKKLLQGLLYKPAQDLRDGGEFLKSLGFHIDAGKLVKHLSMGEKQLVQIAKVLMLNPKLLILDEITSLLTEYESSLLFRAIRSLRERGTAVVFVSHRISEILQLCDRIAVFRNGEMVEVFQSSDTDAEGLLQASTGETYGNRYPKLPVKRGGVFFEVKDLELDGVFRDIRFRLRRGEILGIAGLVGSGRSAIAKTLAGIMRKTKGSLHLDGEVLNIKSPRQAYQKGIVYLGEDRLTQSLFPDQDIKNNLLVNLGRRKVVLPRYERAKAGEIIRKFIIKPSDYRLNIRQVSGGNQQKIVIARLLQSKYRIIIMDEPTSGMDTGAKVEIYNIMNKMVQEGRSIILISSDLSELCGMCDRVVVLYDGTIKDILEKKDISLKNVLYLATGVDS